MARSAASLRVVSDEEPTIASLTEKLAVLAEKRRPYEQHVDAINKEMTPIKNQLLPLMLKEGLLKATGKTASVTVTTREAYEIIDVDAVIKYLKKHGFLHVLQLGLKEARECEERFGKPIPGAELKKKAPYLTVSGIGK